MATLTFLESEIKLGLKPLPTLQIHRVHYLKQAQMLLAWANEESEPAVQRALEQGADLCAFQAMRLKEIAEQRQRLDAEYVRSKLADVRTVRQLEADMAAREAVA